MEQQIFENKLLEIWGSKIFPSESEDYTNLKSHFDLNLLSNENIIYLSDIFLKNSFPSEFGYYTWDDNYDIWQLVRDKLYNKNHYSIRIKPIMRCYDIPFNDYPETDGFFSLGTLYLIAEIENYLKTNSNYLDRDGIIKKEIPKQLRKIISSHNYKKGKRINQIADIIKIYCYRNSSPFSSYLLSYNKKFIDYHHKKSNIRLREIDIDIKSRINKTRNKLMHGEISYTDTEFFFYLTLHSIMFLYDENMYDT